MPLIESDELSVPGDAENDYVEYIIKNNRNQRKVTVLKTGHHGGVSSSSDPSRRS